MTFTLLQEFICANPVSPGLNRSGLICSSSRVMGAPTKESLPDIITGNNMTLFKNPELIEPIDGGVEIKIDGLA